MKNLIVIILLCCAVAAHSQEGQDVSGFVYEESNGEQHTEKEHLLPMANVYWEGTTTGTTSDMDGYFKLSGEGIELPAILVVSVLGYNETHLTITDWNDAPYRIFLKSAELEGVVVVDHVAATQISTVDPFGVENLSSDELAKAACCNLGESFETNASVDVVMNDAVSGSRKIQMLGLDGYYTQITFENIPIIRGIDAAHGLSSVPGTWIESIQVSKGAGSVVNGFESITGQINLEYIKPDGEETENLYVNLYGNYMGRAELNTHWATQLSPKWSQMTFVHGSNFFLDNDHNHDGFLDMPRGYNVNIMNRWKDVRENSMSQFGFRIEDSDRIGGQAFRGSGHDAHSHNQHSQTGDYVIDMKARHYELFAKSGFVLKRPGTSIGLIGTARRHEQLLSFGAKEYNGVENYGYLNAIFQTYLGNTQHTLKLGPSFMYDNYDETYNDSNYTREEIVPGAFAEYTYNNGEYFSVVLGGRVDHHNLFGTFFTPRVHLKWNPKELMAVRLSVGRGQRTPNVVPENASILASSRELIMTETLDPEVAWNFGAVFTWKFEIGEMEGYFNTDYYYTYFVNQAVADLDLDPQQVVVSNLDGESYSHSIQTELGLEPIERLWLKAAYKRYDVWTTYHGELLQRPLVPTDRALFNIGYSNMSEIWKFDVTLNWFGEKRIPNTSTNWHQYRLPEFSDPYFTLNAQVTKEFRHFEIYVGCENILNFIQEDAIIAADDPFGPFFDASLIWGPVNGRVIYGGLRLRID